MTTYEKSIKILRKEFKTKDIRREEWDEYAHLNCLFSAFTIMTNQKVKTWEELKDKLVKRKEREWKKRDDNGKYLYQKIRETQKQLDYSVEKRGINASKTRELSNRIDELINRYYEEIETRQFLIGNQMYQYYLESYYQLKNYTEDILRFPTKEEWNQVAKRNYLISAESIAFIASSDWKFLGERINRERKIKLF